MDDQNRYKKLQYEHEVLWARYEIREHYLKHVVQDVYQGTGQILSLVRVQLGLLSTGNMWSPETTMEPGNLVGKAIHDLRDMCRYFSPETELIEDGNFVESIRHELERTGIVANSKPVKVKGEPGPLSMGTELIVFRMLQEILKSTKKQLKEGFTIKIDYTQNRVTFLMRYTGAPIRLDEPGPAAAGISGQRRLNLQERVKVIDGKLQLVSGKDGSVHIKLIIPFKTPHYDQ